MEKITIEYHVFDQNRILFWGVPCGYCGIAPGRPVCFLAGRQNALDDGEKADVIAYVQEQVGAVKRTKQTRKAFDVLDTRANPDER